MPALTNPVVLDGDVSVEKLRQLLDLQRESADLDYKSECDVARTQDSLELIKDVGAMMMAGGYVIIGADNQGNPTGGLTALQGRNFDEARLRPKIERYVAGPIQVSTQVHQVDANLLAIIFIAPCEKGYAMFLRLGQYQDGGRTKVVFNEGDIYYRRGTSSGRLDPQGFEQLIDRLRQKIRAEERGEFARQLASARDELAAAFRGRQVALGPASNVDFSLDAALFDEATMELMRRGDAIPLRRLMRSAPRLVEEAMAEEGWEDEVTPILDRIASLGGLSLFLDEYAWFEEAVAALVGIYSTCGSEEYSQKATRLWLMLIERVIALGGLAVRLQNWQAVVLLTVQRPAGIHTIYPSWLRHALTWSARLKLLVDQKDGREIELSLIVEAQTVAKSIDALHPDIGDTGDVLLSSLARFDFLACLISIAAVEEIGRSVFYPNFARFYTERTEPIVERLIQDGQGPMRQAIYPKDDSSLARALAYLNDIANREAFRYAGWMGFQSPEVLQFLQANLVEP